MYLLSHYIVQFLLAELCSVTTDEVISQPSQVQYTYLTKTDRKGEKTTFSYIPVVCMCVQADKDFIIHL